MPTLRLHNGLQPSITRSIHNPPQLDTSDHRQNRPGGLSLFQTTPRSLRDAHRQSAIATSAITLSSRAQASHPLPKSHPLCASTARTIASWPRPPPTFPPPAYPPAGAQPPKTSSTNTPSANAPTPPTRPQYPPVSHTQATHTADTTPVSAPPKRSTAASPHSPARYHPPCASPLRRQAHGARRGDP